MLPLHGRTGVKTEIFRDNGTAISAGSVGIVYRGKLYVGQIMEPFVLEILLD